MDYHIRLEGAILVDQIGKRPLQLRNEVRSTAKVEAPISIPATERRAFELMNAQRQAAGLPSLQWSEEAARLASTHVQSMAEGRFFSHRGPDGETVEFFQNATT